MARDIPLLMSLLCASLLPSPCGASARAQSGVTSRGQVTTTNEPVRQVCQQDPHAGVHDPERLKVLNPCATFVGVVVGPPKLNPGDGDITFDVKPDPAYAAMLNSVNQQKGYLHLEIVPKDQPGCTPGQPVAGSFDNLGTCSGLDVIYPPLGAHVRATGPWVLDEWTGWNEIHPVWKVEVIAPTGPPPPEPHTFVARFVGKNRAGSPLGAAHVIVTTVATKLCWAFSSLGDVGKPSKATINRGRTASATVVVTLGSRFSARGCRRVGASIIGGLVTSSGSYYVTLYAPRLQGGAVRGPLRHASD